MLSLCPAASAQTESDTELWSTVGADVDLPHALRASAAYSLRLDNDGGDLKSTFTRLSLRYSATDWLRVRAGYRYYLDRDGETAHRLYGDAGLRYRPKGRKWRLRYRVRLQTTTRPDPDEDLTYLRNRVGGSYEVADDVSPFASAELYYRFRDQSSDEFRRYRVTAGVEWELAKRTTLAAFYLFQKEINVGSPEQDHVLGLELNYRVD